MDKRKRQTTQWPNEKDRQHNGQTKKEKMTNYKALHIKLKTGEIIENVGKSVFFIYFFIKVVFIHKLFIRKIKHIE
jgi:hypothetical protein